MQNKRLIQEMNKISREITGVVFKKRPLIECNVMGCRNKPIHKLYLEKFKRTLWCCKKHRVDFGENYKGETK